MTQKSAAADLKEKKMSDTLEVKVGQIWQEVDPRVERYLRVMRLEGRFVFVETVTKNSDLGWCRPDTSYTNSRCQARRFNGKRGGYKLFEDVA